MVSFASFAPWRETNGFLCALGGLAWASSGLKKNQPGHVAEVPVAGEELEAMLEGYGRDPDIVGGDGGALGFEADEDLGVEFGGFLVDSQERYAR